MQIQLVPAAHTSISCTLIIMVTSTSIHAGMHEHTQDFKNSSPTMARLGGMPLASSKPMIPPTQYLSKHISSLLRLPDVLPNSRRILRCSSWKPVHCQCGASYQSASIPRLKSVGSIAKTRWLSDIPTERGESHGKAQYPVIIQSASVI